MLTNARTVDKTPATELGAKDPLEQGRPSAACFPEHPDERPAQSEKLTAEARHRGWEIVADLQDVSSGRKTTGVTAWRKLSACSSVMRPTCSYAHGWIG